MLIKVEKSGLVVEISVSDLLHQTDELLVIPSGRRVLDHDVDRVIVFIVSGVKVSNLSPQEESLAHSKKLGLQNIL